MTPVETVKALLAGRKDLDTVRALCTPDVTYVSLNYSDPELHKSMPWCGTYHGAEELVSTFVRVEQYWHLDDFSPEAIFGDEDHVAVFGRFTLTSTVMKQTVTSPFSIFFKLKEGKINYMQYMEDTFGTALTFRSGGSMTFRSNPAGGEVTVP